MPPGLEPLAGRYSGTPEPAGGSRSALLTCRHMVTGHRSPCLLTHAADGSLASAPGEASRQSIPSPVCPSICSVADPSFLIPPSPFSGDVASPPCGLVQHPLSVQLPCLVADSGQPPSKAQPPALLGRTPGSVCTYTEMSFLPRRVHIRTHKLGFARLCVNTQSQSAQVFLSQAQKP